MKKILIMLGCLITTGAQIVAGEPNDDREMGFNREGVLAFLREVMDNPDRFPVGEREPLIPGQWWSSKHQRYMTPEELKDYKEKFQQTEADAICTGRRFQELARNAADYQRDCYQAKKIPSLKEFQKDFFEIEPVLRFGIKREFPFTEVNTQRILRSGELRNAFANCRTYEDLVLAADKKFVMKITAGIASVTAVATQAVLSYMSSHS